MGDCYQANAKEIMYNNSLKGAILIHGVALLSSDKKPFGHCWVEVGSTCYDYSNGREIKKSKLFYYNMVAIDGLMKKGYKQFRYKGEEIAKNILKQGHWGPWGNTGAKR